MGHSAFLSLYTCVQLSLLVVQVRATILSFSTQQSLTNQTCLDLMREKFTVELNEAQGAAGAHRQLVSGRLNGRDEHSNWVVRTVWRTGNALQANLLTVDANLTVDDVVQKDYSPLEIRDEGIFIQGLSRYIDVYIFNSSVNRSYVVDISNYFTEILVSEAFFTFSLDKEKKRLLLLAEGVDKNPAPWALYRPEVGGARNPTLFILDLYDQKLNSVDLPYDLVPGRSMWDPRANGIIINARRRKPNPCPLCPDSESLMVYIDLDSKTVVPNMITQPGFHISSPVLCPHGTSLYFLRNNITDDQGVPVSDSVSRDLVYIHLSSLKEKVLIDSSEQVSDNFHGIKRTNTDTAIFFYEDEDEEKILINNDDVIGARGGSLLVYHLTSSELQILDRPVKVLDVMEGQVLAASINLTHTQLFLGSLEEAKTTTTTTEMSTTEVTEVATTTTENPTTTAQVSTTSSLPLSCQEILDSYRNEGVTEENQHNHHQHHHNHHNHHHTTTAATENQHNHQHNHHNHHHTTTAATGLTEEQETELNEDATTTQHTTTTEFETMFTTDLATTTTVPRLSVMSGAGLAPIYSSVVPSKHYHYHANQPHVIRAINKLGESSSLMAYLPTERNQQIKMELIEFWLALGWDVLHLGYELGGSMKGLLEDLRSSLDHHSHRYDRTVLVGEGFGGSLALLLASENKQDDSRLQVVSIDGVLDLHSLILLNTNMLARLQGSAAVLPLIPQQILDLWNYSPISKLNQSPTTSTTPAAVEHIGNETLTKRGEAMNPLSRVDILLFSTNGMSKQSELFHELAQRNNISSTLLVNQGLSKLAEGSPWFSEAAVWLYQTSGIEDTCRLTTTPSPSTHHTGAPITTSTKSSGVATAGSHPATTSIIFIFLSLAAMF